MFDFLWWICDTVTSWGLTDKGLTQTFDQKRGFDRIVGAIWIPRIASQSLASFFLKLNLSVRLFELGTF